MYILLYWLFVNQSQSEIPDICKLHSNFRSEVLNIATEYATSLGLREREHPLIYQWYADFMSRWPELKLMDQEI